MVLAAILFMDHSKTEPFENRTTSTIRNPNAFGIRAPTVCVLEHIGVFNRLEKVFLLLPVCLNFIFVRSNMLSFFRPFKR